MTPKIFISYARGDDEAFAKMLYEDLSERDFDVWRDRESLHSIQLVFHQQIKDAIREKIDRLIYIAGPKASVSDYVREEWLFALECDKPVIPILRKGDYDCIPGDICLLHCEDFRDDSKYSAQLEKLVDNLHRPEPSLGHLFAVPSLPPHFLGRPEIMRKLKDSILIDLQKPVVETGSSSQVGIQGMGGIGKSVLASAVARDREIRRSYPDGIIWISFGQTPDILKILQDISNILGNDTILKNVAQAHGILRSLLISKSILFVMDDIWKASDAKVFDFLGPRCKALITTRDSGILHTLDGKLYPVELFTKEEALRLLADSVGQNSENLPQEAHEIVIECGCLPLAISLCGGMAKKRDGEWKNILKRLKEAKLEKISDRESINEQHQSIWKAMQISVESLEPDEQKRFAELSAFFNDVYIPKAAIETLWNYTGNLDELDTEDLLINLHERSLIHLEKKELENDKTFRLISLHDLLYDYAFRTAGEPKELQRKLLDSYHKKCTKGKWYMGPNDGYFYQNLCRHFINIEDLNNAIGVLTNIHWISFLCVAGLLSNLISDYKYILNFFPEAKAELEEERLRLDNVIKYTEDMITYSSKWNEARKKYFTDSQKYPMPSDEDIPLPEVIISIKPWYKEEFTKEIERFKNFPNILDLFKTYSHFVISESSALSRFGKIPGFVYQQAYNYASFAKELQNQLEFLKYYDGKICFLLAIHKDRPINPFPSLINTFDGHKHFVSSVSISSDGRRAISGSWDKTIRYWDLESGVCLKVFEGDSGIINIVKLLKNGKMAISINTDEKKMYIWDLEKGKCYKEFQIDCLFHYHVSITPDGSRALTANNRVLFLWDLEKGECIKNFIVNENSFIESITLSTNGNKAYVYCSNLNIYVWDLIKNSLIITYEMQMPVFSITQDGKFAVLRVKETFIIWDIEKEKYISVLEGHKNTISDIKLTADGKYAVSVSTDKTLRLWHIGSGLCIRVFEGHTDSIDSVSITPDGIKAISGGLDTTVRLWDLEKGISIIEDRKHSGSVNKIALAECGKKAISGGTDGTLFIWNLETGESVKLPDDHKDLIYSISITPEFKKAVTSCKDKTIRIWDLEKAECVRVIEECMDYVKTVVSSCGKKIISYGGDKTIRLWDLETGECIKILEGHEDYIQEITITHNGSVAISSSVDKTIRLWDLEKGECIKVLNGHKSSVQSVLITPDEKKIISGDKAGEMRVWDIESEECLYILESHYFFNSPFAFTPDGEKLISIDRNNNIIISNLETGKCLKVLKGHTFFVHTLVISSDGKYAISAGYDNTIWIWDLESGKCKSVCSTNSNVMSYSEELRVIITGTKIGQVKFFELKNIY